MRSFYSSIYFPQIKVFPFSDLKYGLWWERVFRRVPKRFQFGLNVLYTNRVRENMVRFEFDFITTSLNAKEEWSSTAPETPSFRLPTTKPLPPGTPTSPIKPTSIDLPDYKINSKLINYHLVLLKNLIQQEKPKPLKFQKGSFDNNHLNKPPKEVLRIFQVLLTQKKKNKYKKSHTLLLSVFSPFLTSSLWIHI